MTPEAFECNECSGTVLVISKITRGSKIHTAKCSECSSLYALTQRRDDSVRIRKIQRGTDPGCTYCRDRQGFTVNPDPRQPVYNLHSSGRLPRDPAAHWTVCRACSPVALDPDPVPAYLPAVEPNPIHEGSWGSAAAEEPTLRELIALQTEEIDYRPGQETGIEGLQ